MTGAAADVEEAGALVAVFVIVDWTIVVDTGSVGAARLVVIGGIIVLVLLIEALTVVGVDVSGNVVCVIVELESSLELVASELDVSELELVLSVAVEDAVAFVDVPVDLAF